MHRIMLSLLILVGVFYLTACNSLGLLQPTSPPTPKCFGKYGSWSYAENVQTEIDISVDLTITMTKTPCALCYPYTVTINGDGRVVYTSESRQASEPAQKITIEKQIPIDQLQQIVTIFEEANFYAISLGCAEEGVGKVHDAGFLDISVVTDGEIYEIDDQGVCAIDSFDKYCALGNLIDSILGTPW